MKDRLEKLPLKFIIKQPSHCSNDEIEAFCRLVKQGGQVKHHGLKERVSKSEWLGFCFYQQQLIGIAAIKNPSKNYKQTVFQKAGVTSEKENYHYEIGYAFTVEKFRGKGINLKLTNNLIHQIGTQKLYCTTGHEGMKSMLERLGFKQLGRPYRSELTQNLLRLFGLQNVNFN